MASLLPSLLETQAPQRFYGRSTLPSETKKSSESVWDSWRKVTWEVHGLWIWMNINEDKWNMKECGSLALWNYDMTLYMAFWKVHRHGKRRVASKPKKSAVETPRPETPSNLQKLSTNVCPWSYQYVTLVLPARHFWCLWLFKKKQGTFRKDGVFTT